MTRRPKSEKWAKALWWLLGAILLVQTVRSVDQIWDFNDFDVYYMSGRLALEKSGDLYTARSPEKERPFLYPPPSALLLAPLAVLPYKAAGVVFTLVKMGALVFLLWGGLRMFGAEDGKPAGAGLPLLVLMLCFRPVNNDIGNGQINLIVTALAVGGVWLLMARPKGIWVGGGLLALAVALKATPALLLAIPLLHRRWKALGATVVWLAALLLLIPCMWFGPARTGALYREFREISSGQVLHAREKDRQVSLSEIVVFTAAQIKADDDLIEDDGKLYRLVEGEKQRVRLPAPFSQSAGMALYLCLGLGVGAAFLGGRRLLFRRREGDWAWDLAMLCTLMPLLSPMVRKAHLVVLLVPAAFVVCRLCQAGLDASISSRRQKRFAWATLLLFAAFLYISESLALPSPGPLPYVIAHFLSLCMMILTLISLALPTPPGLPRRSKD